MSEAAKSNRTRRIPPVLAGLAACAAALGVGELVAAALGVRSPIIAVGGVVIDNVPSFVKDFAIATFGTNDKPALIIGILSFLAIFAGVVGLLAWKSLKLAGLALIVFAAIGVAAGVAGPDPVERAVVPTPVGVAVAFGALALIRRSRIESSGDEIPSVSRRSFLAFTGGVVAVAAASAAGGRWLQSRTSAVAARAAVLLPIPRQRLEPIPAAAQVDVPGMTPFITPNKDFYRIDTALVVPQVQTDAWELKISGMVDKPFSLSFDELLELPMVERDVTLTCVSNQVGGQLVGNARWIGYPLGDLLERAGVDPTKATQIVGRSVDGFFTGFPTAAAFDGRTALVAVGMNGEPLPLEHGFPARLVIAGLYGYVSATKWLTEIELTTLESFDSYWVRRGWGKFGPIFTQSRVDVPRGFAQLQPGKVPVAGVAWAQTRGIRKVEVQIDDGPWNEAELGAEVGDSTWRQWRYEWDATPGGHNIQVRATDGRGELQTSARAEPIPSGATGWHSVFVTVA